MTECVVFVVSVCLSERVCGQSTKLETAAGMSVSLMLEGNDSCGIYKTLLTAQSQLSWCIEGAILVWREMF